MIITTPVHVCSSEHQESAALCSCHANHPLSPHWARKARAGVVAAPRQLAEWALFDLDTPYGQGVGREWTVGYGLSTLTAGATSLSNKFSSANRHPSFIIANRRPHLLPISSSSPTPETVLERHRPAKHGHNNNKGTTAHPFRFLESTDPQRRAHTTSKPEHQLPAID